MENLLTVRGWTNAQVAIACKVSPEHVSDIIGGSTKSCRRNTYVKLVSGLMELGASEEEAKAVFA